MASPNFEDSGRKTFPKMQKCIILNDCIDYWSELTSSYIFPLFFLNIEMVEELNFGENSFLLKDTFQLP